MDLPKLRESGISNFKDQLSLEICDTISRRNTENLSRKIVNPLQ